MILVDWQVNFHVSTSAIQFLFLHIFWNIAVASKLACLKVIETAANGQTAVAAVLEGTLSYEGVDADDIVKEQ